MQCYLCFNVQLVAEYYVQILCKPKGLCKSCANRKSGLFLCKSCAKILTLRRRSGGPVLCRREEMENEPSARSKLPQGIRLTLNASF